LMAGSTKSPVISSKQRVVLDIPKGQLAGREAAMSWDSPQRMRLLLFAGGKLAGEAAPVGLQTRKTAKTITKNRPLLEHLVEKFARTKLLSYKARHL